MNCVRKQVARGIGTWSSLPTALVVPAGAIPASAQQDQAAGQATYTVEQAAAGGESYQAACAACHLVTLLGSGEAPPLMGPNFQTVWGSRMVSELLEYTRAAMPPEAPGSLSEEETSAVLAYIIQENGVGAGSDPLGFSSGGQVVMLPDGNTGLARAGSPEAIFPVPGRPGNVPSPNARNSPPEGGVGELHETTTSVTRTFRAIEGFSPVSDPLRWCSSSRIDLRGPGRLRIIRVEF